MKPVDQSGCGSPLLLDRIFIPILLVDLFVDGNELLLRQYLSYFKKFQKFQMLK